MAASRPSRSRRRPIIRVRAALRWRRTISDFPDDKPTLPAFKSKVEIVMRDIDKEIIQFGEGLKGRLDPALIDFALGYISHSEVILAFETLCDYIADYEIKIRRNEYQKILDIVNSLGLEINSRYTYINPEKV